MEFHPASKWFFLLLLLVPLIWWRYLGARGRTAIRFSSLEIFAKQPATWAVRARHIVPLLRTLAVVLLVIALARLREGNEETRVLSEAVAIQMIVDRSGSMEAMDFQIDGEPVDRLTAVKNVVNGFVLGDEGLPGRPDDLIGLIVFGTFADSLCPLTLDHDHFINSLEEAQIAKTQQEGATAIGDAIALGVERLRQLEAQRGLSAADEIKSKIIVLLTDGESNAGDLEPLQAAEIAASYGIKVYTIGAGTRGMAPFRAQDIFGRSVMRSMPVSIDEDTLREIADMTGGRYFRATDTASLRNIYVEIDKLEKTEIEQRRYMQYKELATASIVLGSVRLPSLLLCVLILLVVEVLLGNTRFRKIP